MDTNPSPRYPTRTLGLAAVLVAGAGLMLAGCSTSDEPVYPTSADASLSAQDRSVAPNPTVPGQSDTAEGKAPNPSTGPQPGVSGGQGTGTGSAASTGQASWTGGNIFSTPDGTRICQFPGTEEDGCKLAWDHRPAFDGTNRCPYPGVDAAKDTAIGFRRGSNEAPCHWLVQGEWPQSGTVLQYGQSATFTQPDSPVTCTMEEAGLTCENKLGHGFFIAETSYRVW